MSNDQLAYRKLSSFSLALHGWNERFHAEKLLPLFDRYFANAGVVAQEGNVQGAAPVELKGYSMRTIRKRIENLEIYGLIGLTSYHFVDRTYKSSHDYLLSYDTNFDSERCEFVNAVSPETERYGLAIQFLRDMLEYITPCYGYSLEMPLGHDPALFAVGMYAYNEEDRDETHVWQQACDGLYGNNAHKHGKMRHVFAINVLSRPHMEALVEGKTFAEWVKGPNRGSIEELKNGVWLWQVPKELRIGIAKTLSKNGILTAPKGFEKRLIG